MLNLAKKYYSSDERLQLHEVRWVRLKLASVIVAGTLLFLAGIVGVNHLAHDPLGFGYDRARDLARENAILQQQIEHLKQNMANLSSSVHELNSEGNQLRLMVDLPQIDRDVASGGTGGAVVEPSYALNSEEQATALQSTLTTLQQLSSEVKIQQQSYAQIIDKYKYNKGYFAALPALKPMDGYYSRSGFGLRMHPVLGIFRTHEGLDIVNDVGTPVYAAGDGVVAMSGQSGGGYGIVVVINHGYDFQTLYAHLSKVLVREGQRVRRGDLIAKSGKTGLVSGPHLHYEVRYKGVCKNPVDFFLDDVRPGSFQANLASR